MARMSSVLQYNGSTNPNPNLHLSFQDTLFYLIACLFDNMHVFPFVCFLCLYAPLCAILRLFSPLCAFFVSLFSFHLFTGFAFFCCCMYKLGAKVQLPRHKLGRAKNASKKTQAQEGQWSIDLGILAPFLCGYLFLFLSLFFRTRYQGLLSLYLAFGHIHRLQ